jgi:hypothetical protein
MDEALDLSAYMVPDPAPTTLDQQDRRLQIFSPMSLAMYAKEKLDLSKWRFDPSIPRWLEASATGHWNLLKQDPVTLSKYIHDEIVSHMGDDAPMKLLRKIGTPAFRADIVKDLRLELSEDGFYSSLDLNDELLVFSDCVLDLRTMERRPIRPEDRIGRISTDYPFPQPDEGMQRILLEGFHQAMPVEEERIFMEKSAAGVLLGGSREHRVMVLQGQGGNFKSLFLRLMEMSLGGYACRIKKAAICGRSTSDNPHDDWTKTKGTRFVFTEETKGHDTLQVDVICEKSGCGSFVARECGVGTVTIHPRFELWLGLNATPKFSDHGDMMNRRMINTQWRVSFRPTHLIPDDGWETGEDGERRPKGYPYVRLADPIWEDRKNDPLFYQQWMLILLGWFQKYKLIERRPNIPPQSVRVDTAKFLNVEMQEFREFISLHFTRGEDASTLVHDVLSEYTDYFNRKIDGRRLRGMMEASGFVYHNDSRGTWYAGLRRNRNPHREDEKEGEAEQEEQAFRSWMKQTYERDPAGAIPARDIASEFHKGHPRVSDADIWRWMAALDYQCKDTLDGPVCLVRPRPPPKPVQKDGMTGFESFLDKHCCKDDPDTQLSLADLMRAYDKYAFEHCYASIKHDSSLISAMEGLGYKMTDGMFVGLRLKQVD